jgi:hypothetical protein
LKNPLSILLILETPMHNWSKKSWSQQQVDHLACVSVKTLYVLTMKNLLGNANMIVNDWMLGSVVDTNQHDVPHGIRDIVVASGSYRKNRVGHGGAQVQDAAVFRWSPSLAAGNVSLLSHPLIIEVLM